MCQVLLGNTVFGTLYEEASININLLDFKFIINQT